MSEPISIEGLDRADVLAALYNDSKPQGMGFLHYDPKPMTRIEAQHELLATDSGPWPGDFDYLKGRVMKVQLKPGATEFYGHLYDRDLGEGAAARAISRLREKLGAIA